MSHTMKRAKKTRSASRKMTLELGSNICSILKVETLSEEPLSELESLSELELLSEQEPRVWMPPPSSALVKQTPRPSSKGSIEPKRVLEDSIFLAPLEKAAECDLDEEEAHDYYEKVRQWVNELPDTSEGIRSSCSNPVSVVNTNGTGTTVSKHDDGPSIQETSRADDILSRKKGKAQKSAQTEADGSEFDSDFDDEFEPVEFADCTGTLRDIPNNEEMDDSTRHIITSVEMAMDDAIEELTGVSTEFHWEEDFATFKSVPEPFTGPTPGPVQDYDTPYDAFIDIWSTDIIQHIVRETNRYAKQVIESKTGTGTLLPTSRLRHWSDTDQNEIYMLLAIYMLMGLDPRASQHEFWKTTGYLEMPKFRELLTYNRFILLNKFIHFVDNSELNQDLPNGASAIRQSAVSAKLRKIAPLLRHLNEKFQTLYNLHPDVAIDESLTLFKGRLSWVQAIRTKAARYSIKSYELCESKTGYLFRFEIDTGKNHDRDQYVAPNLAKAGQVVLSLLDGLDHRGHCVSMDNFYNCPALARHLKSQGFDCLGTLRPCRKNVPLEIKTCKQTVPNGTIIARHAGDISCLTWKDKELVNMISTYHNGQTYVGRKAGTTVVKPVVVRDYNNTMGGVDLKDKKLSMYLIERKRCVKWYIKMFKRLLNVSVHNALILYLGSMKRRNLPPITHRDFREKLANSLVSIHRKVSIVNMVKPVGDSMRLRKDIVHTPTYLRSNMRRECHMCYRKGVRKAVHLKCVTCDEYLCFNKCWTDYHSLQKLPGKVIVRRKRRV